MDKLSLQDLTELFAARTKLTAEEATQFAKAIFDVVGSGLEQDKLVKVRGLGTFKIIDVEQRESVNVNTGERVTIEGHEKLTFTPDTTMKELVNHPFSQFETVVLNDGVDFSEMEQQEELPTEDSYEESTPEATTDEQPTAETTDNASDDMVWHSEDFIVGEKDSIPPLPIPETSLSDDDAEELEEDEEEDDSIEEIPENDDTNKGNRIWDVVLWVLLFVVVIGASGYIGYLYGTNKALVDGMLFGTHTENDIAIEREQSQPSDLSGEWKELERLSFANLNRKKKEQKLAATEEKEHSTEPTVDYGERDARVRTGAYRIVGTQSEVVVKQGETIETISRRALGPGMECYVEVYNNLQSGAEIKEGQKIKIPKLELKKKTKTRNATDRLPANDKEGTGTERLGLR